MKCRPKATRSALPPATIAPAVAALKPDAGLDAAVAFLDHGFADEFLRRRGFEVGFDFGFQGRLIALQRQQKIGLVFDDLGGDFDLTPDGVDVTRAPSSCSFSAR
jgi:hypothetical protein